MNKFYETHIDELGRVQIPEELGEVISQYLPEGNIEIIERQFVGYLKEKGDRCVICNESADLQDVSGTRLCMACIVAIQNDELAIPIRADEENTYFIDEKYRMHIPCAVRKELGVNLGKNRGRMIVYLDEELHQLIAKPVIAGCMLCGSETICEVGVVHLCPDCLNKITGY